MADKSVVQLEIQSLLDGKGFDETKKQLKNIGVDIKKTGEDGEFSLSKIDASAKRSGESFINLAAKVTVAWKSITSLIKASIDQAKADAQLAQAIRNNTDARQRDGKSVSQLTKEYKDFASAQQEATGIGDEVTQQLQTLLVSFGTAPKLVNRVTAAFQDMAAATGQDASMMARAWGRLQEAPEEALGALSRVGIKIRKEQLAGMDIEKQRIFVLEQLEQKFKGQAKVMADATGGVMKLEAAFGDFMEVVGNVVLTVLGPLIDGLAKMISAFNSASPPIQALILLAGGLTFAFVSLRTAGITSFAALSTAVKSFIASMGPIGWIVTAIGAVAVALGSMESEAEKAAKRIEKLKRAVEEADAKIATMGKDIGNSSELEAFVARISRMEEGTQEYKNALQELMKLDPLMAASLKNTNANFRQVQLSLADVTRQYRQAAADRARTIANDLSQQYNEAAALLRDNPLDEQLQIQVASMSRQLGRALGSYMRIAYGANAARWRINEAQQVIDPEAQARNRQNYRAGDFTRIMQNAAAQRRGEQLPFPDLAGREREAAPAEVQNSVRDLLQNITAQFRPSITNSINQGIIESTRVAELPAIQIPVTTSGSGERVIQEAVDVWQMRINLMEDEFEKRRQQSYKDYLQETAHIEQLAIDEKDKLALLDGVNKKYLDERAKIEKDYEEKLKEERIKAYNEALTIMQRGLSLGTSIIKKDWKSAISETLSMIPGVGQTLSGVFGTAVDFFGEVFGAKSKTEAEKLGDWLEAAVQQFDKSFTRSETYSKLFGDLDLTAIDAEISSIQAGLDPLLSRLGLGANATREDLRGLFDYIKKADYRNLDWSKYTASGTGWLYGRGTKPTQITKTGNIFQESNYTRMTDDYKHNLVEQIRELFADMYGEFGDEMMSAMGLTGSDDAIWKKWTGSVRKDLTGMNAALLEVTKQTATWMDQLEDAQLKRGLAKTKDELDRINKKYEIGEYTQEEMVKRSSEQIDNALEYLRTLEPTQEVLDAIDDLLLQQINLQKQLNDESAEGLDIEDEKLRKLLQQREELERDIASGYVREGTSDTVSRQAAILRQIIARAKEIGLSRDDYFQYEEALANLMESFGGASYTGKTGFGYTPTVDDLTGGDIGITPVGSREYQASVNAARASRVSTSNTNTTNQTITINGQAMVPNQEFVDGLRTLTRRVYGKDIIK